MLIMSRRSPVLQPGLLPEAAAATAASIEDGELPLWPEDSDFIEDPVPDIGLADDPIVE